MRRPLQLASLAVVAGCGADATTVQLVVPGHPVVAEVRDAGGTWHDLSGRDDGTTTTYQVEVDGELAIAMVCETDAGFRAAELYAVAEDAPIALGSWVPPSCVAAPGVDATVHVTGQVLDATHVALGATVQNASDGMNPWPFAIDVAPGVRDVVLRGNTAMRIVHDVRIDGPVDLGVLPLVPLGTPMVVKSFSVPTASSETVIASSIVATRSGTTFVSTNAPENSVFAPPEQLAPGDQQSFSVVVYSSAFERAAWLTDFASVPPDFDLLPPLTPIETPLPLAASWAPFTDVYFTTATASFHDALNTQTATASRAWLLQHPDANITFDEDVPHYRADWHIAAPDFGFTVEQWAPGVRLSTSTTRSF